MSELDHVREELRAIRAELVERREAERPTPEGEPRPRITQAEVLRYLLERQAKAGGEHSTVRLTRNAKGDTQIEVSVRTGEHEGIETVEAAAGKAQEVYDVLRAMYPLVGVEVPGAGA